MPQTAGMVIWRALLLIVLSLSPASVAIAQAGPQVGDTYQITRNSETSQQSGDGSTGDSHDRDTIIERVIGLREDGMELEYDLPSEATAEERAEVWQFPARVFKPLRGPMQLLNRPELETRVEAWLRAAEWDRAVCGHWIFTWNAFRIECDPESVIQTLESFDLGPDNLRDGALFEDPHARSAAPLRRTAAGPEGATFVVELSIDPDAVRRDSAEADLVVAEISGETLTREEALRAHASEDISGTMTFTFETDPVGRVRRRVRVMELQIREPNGQSETRRATETLERRLVSRPST